MNTVKVRVTAEKDGQLTLQNVPVRKGDQVDAVLLIPDATDARDRRQQARQRLLALSQQSKFVSTRPYPTRDELHERR